MPLGIVGLAFLGCLCGALSAQTPANSPNRLDYDEVKNGEETRRVLRPMAAKLRDSVVKIDVDGNTVALGLVVDASGLVLTKASELRPGRLSCWLARGGQVGAERLAVDDQNDVALIRVAAKGLKPVSWSEAPAIVGQWVVTPGIAELPQSMGIVSVPPRRILHPRALIGVQLNRRLPGAVVESVMEGLAAKQAGLKAGDKVLQLNGREVTDGDQLIRELREFREGQSVQLRVRRAEEEFDVTLAMKVPDAGPGGRGVDRAERMNRMGSTPSARAEGFGQVIQHDTVLQNWQCGGPLVDLDGRVLGMNIARAGRVASYALPSDLVRSTYERLRSRAVPGASGKTGE